MTLRDLVQKTRGKRKAGNPPELRRLIPEREAIVLREMVSGTKPGLAVMKAGFSVRNINHAAAVGRAIFEKHSDENGALVEALENVGVTFDKIAKRMSEGLDATKSRMVKRGGEWKETEEPDHNVRHKFVETSLRVRNAEPPKRVDIRKATFESQLFEIINSSPIEDAEIISGDN